MVRLRTTTTTITITTTVDADGVVVATGGTDTVARGPVCSP